MVASSSCDDQSSSSRRGRRFAETVRGVSTRWQRRSDFVGNEGHGVVFCYRDTRKTNTPGIPIAFLQGFGWYRGAKTAVVWVLEPGAIPFGSSRAHKLRVLEETKLAVRLFLKHPELGKPGEFNANICCGYNA
jgi:hypothetical protein